MNTLGIHNFHPLFIFPFPCMLIKWIPFGDWQIFPVFHFGQTLHRTTIMNSHQHQQQLLPKTFSQTKFLEFFHNLFLFRFLLAMARVGIGFTWTYLGIPTWGLGVTNIILVFMSISTAKGVGSWICARWCRSSPSLLKFVSSILWIILNIRLNEVL